MKKSILFIIPSLSIGGGEKSLINLLEQIDYYRYDVDLFVLRREGLFLDFVPKQVKFIDISNDLKIFQLPIHKSIVHFLVRGKLSLIYHRVMFSIRNKTSSSISKGEQYSWKHMRRAIGSIGKEYDVAIGYLEKTSNYICVDCVSAKKKIGWIHTDYNKLKADKEFDGIYLSRLDSIITISKECEKVLKKEFSSLKDRITTIKNIVSTATIKKMSLENVDILVKENEKIIISVGRLSHEKGFDIAIKACRVLKDKGYNLKWFFIGEGPERESLQNLIIENSLSNDCILVGASSNPYKYIAKADIYVQPSRFEGKSIAMDEAKILSKPIVATNFSTVNDQLKNRVDGIVTEMTADDLAIGIVNLIEDSKLYSSIVTNLKQQKIGTESEIIKLYELFDSM